MNILIITWSHDNKCIDYVTQAIEKKGGKVYRFNTDLYPTEVMMSAGYHNGSKSLRLKSSDFDIDLDRDIDAIWYRRARLGRNIPKHLDNQLLKASQEESRRTFLGMIHSLQKFILDPFHKIRYTENKQLQLQLAAQIGLEIPRSLFTNDAAAVKKFYAEIKAPIITKMQHSFAIFDEEGKENVVFTNELTEENLQDLDGLDYCPMTFQEKIEKKVELRITIVGDKVFCAAVNSNELESADIDWRRKGRELVKSWTPYELPKEIETKLLQLMDTLGLNYGAADVIVTPDDRYVFLEVNPAGEFFWLDYVFEGQISDALAGVLLDRVPRRNNTIQMPL